MSSSIENPHLPRDYRKATTFLAMAAQLGELSTCDRKKVGAILIKQGRCIAWGYNGAPPGLPHCDENDHGWNGELRQPPGQTATWPADCKKASEVEGCRNVTHAEANAVAFAARQGISTDGAWLYVTVSPCEVCARLLIAAGIHKVIYQEPYRDRAGIELLQRAGVYCIP